MKLILIVGARPNFMKIASIIDAIKTYNRNTAAPEHIKYTLVHTGQHYDDAMSEAFFRDLDLPRPDIYLGIGSGSHAAQTAEIMKRFEPVLLELQPDMVVLVGDVNSTVACALVASKIEYPAKNSGLNTQNLRRKPRIAHVEAGLRSFDRTMPEEINRLLTDAISDFLFTSEERANQNLLCEGISAEKIFFVGNTMIDTLLKHHEKARESNILERLGLKNNKIKTQKPCFATQSSNHTPYCVLTLHRPSNVDNKETFQNILEALMELSKYISIIFPTHPRTMNRIKEFHFERYFEFISLSSGQTVTNNRNIYCLEPLGYLDFLCLMSNAKLVLTDSGGMQEETTVLGIPCVTMRENTERPITITMGTNVIVGTDKRLIIDESLKKIDTGKLPDNPMIRSRKYPPLWDGKAGHRIISILLDRIERP